VRFEVKTVYVARDGKEFPDELSCRSYERDLMEKSLKMWDCKFEKTDNVTRCQHVRLDTEQDVCDMIGVCEWYGIRTDGIKNPGGYTYLDVPGCWMNWNEAIAAFNLFNSLNKKEGENE
jgi:hypothetical protein